MLYDYQLAGDYSFMPRIILLYLKQKYFLTFTNTIKNKFIAKNK